MKGGAGGVGKLKLIMESLEEVLEDNRRVPNVFTEGTSFKINLDRMKNKANSVLRIVTRVLICFDHGSVKLTRNSHKSQMKWLEE